MVWRYKKIQIKGNFKTMEDRIRKIIRNLIGVPQKDTKREKAIFKRTKAKNFPGLIHKHEATKSRNTTYSKQD